MKTIFAFLGSLFFGLAGIFVAWQTRAHQAANQTMPNFKGGFMKYSDGYLLAFALICMAAAWFFFGFNSWRQSQDNDKH
jgi:hypothetical protein